MKAVNIGTYTHSALSLLEHLIATPSFSREEQATAHLLGATLGARGITHQRTGNNIWARNLHYDAAKPTILLNSHHDTVQPNKGYTLDPHQPIIKDGKLYGLGSNDAGGCLVALLETFLHFYDVPGLRYNLICAATAEEEISGKDGIGAILAELGPIDCAIVGEPTKLQLAIAEKGLMVLDCLVTGKSGHAAREEGENAIYKALTDIKWFRTYRFPRSSPFLGDCKMSVTMIEAGVQHNVVPASCRFTVDVRMNECYTPEEMLETIRAAVSCEVTPRSFRLRSTSISQDHPLVLAGKATGGAVFGSATTSDKALMPFPALKMGPGDSARSHTADEFIYLGEIRDGIATYIALLQHIL